MQYRERIIFIGQNIDEELGNQLVGTMLYLDSIDKQKDMYLYINSMGGDVRTNPFVGYLSFTAHSLPLMFRLMYSKCQIEFAPEAEYPNNHWLIANVKCVLLNPLSANAFGMNVRIL